MRIYRSVFWKRPARVIVQKLIGLQRLTFVQQHLRWATVEEIASARGHACFMLPMLPFSRTCQRVVDLRNINALALPFCVVFFLFQGISLFEMPSRGTKLQETEEKEKKNFYFGNSILIRFMKLNFWFIARWTFFSLAFILKIVPFYAYASFTWFTNACVYASCIHCRCACFFFFIHLLYVEMVLIVDEDCTCTRLALNIIKLEKKASKLLTDLLWLIVPSWRRSWKKVFNRITDVTSKRLPLLLILFHQKYYLITINKAAIVLKEKRDA